MIVLDTHIWIWWVHGDSSLKNVQIDAIKKNENKEIGVSIISCWEVAKLVEYGRLNLPCNDATAKSPFFVVRRFQRFCRLLISNNL